MEREIKFRGWDAEIDYMSDYIYKIDLNIGYGYYVDGCENIQRVELKNLMQYTGLKDKNGKEIYEGDILDCQDRIVKVVWHQPAAQFDTTFMRYISDLCSNGITNLEWKYRAEVIGNIYENPELLNEETE